MCTYDRSTSGAGWGQSVSTYCSWLKRWKQWALKVLHIFAWQTRVLTCPSQDIRKRVAMSSKCELTLTSSFIETPLPSTSLMVSLVAHPLGRPRLIYVIAFLWRDFELHVSLTLHEGGNLVVQRQGVNGFFIFFSFHLEIHLFLSISEFKFMGAALALRTRLTAFGILQ